MDHDAYGVKATVIDLGLSRMDANHGSSSSVHFTPFDDEVFEGEGTLLYLAIGLVVYIPFSGDYQFDVYRMMRKHIGKSWETYRPLTNVMVRLLFRTQNNNADLVILLVVTLPR